MNWNPTIPHDLHTLAILTHFMCIDFSTAVINQMRMRFAADSGIEWKEADVRDLPIPSGSIDVAFDKGKLDAMIIGSPWDPPETVRANT